MASLQCRGKSWRIYFNYQGQQHAFTIGEVNRTEAIVWKAQTEELLRLLKRQVVSIPVGCSVEQFMFQRGNPTSEVPPDKPVVTLAEVRDAYLTNFGNGGNEDNSLYTVRIHLAHLTDTLGTGYPMRDLCLADLQKHVAKRQAKVQGVTIKKEIATLRGTWNWACRMKMVEGTFPGSGLVYPKGKEKLPFMTWAEIDRRIKRSGEPEALWECLYLVESEIAEFLDFVQSRKAPSWLYPMCVMAAHTGARRSEMMRAESQDVDFDAGIITIREKKKERARLTTRRVPMSSRLKDALISVPSIGTFLFGKHSEQSVQKAFMRVVGRNPNGSKSSPKSERWVATHGTKWSVVKGYHVLRHSFISLLAARGIDQRVINELAGHTTDAMARRYRHLIPDIKAAAIKQVLG